MEPSWVNTARQAVRPLFRGYCRRILKTCLWPKQSGRLVGNPLGIRHGERGKRKKLRNMVALCRLKGLLDAHPYDLSGGSSSGQHWPRCCCSSRGFYCWTNQPRGLDAEFKAVFAAILRQLTTAGVSVVMVSHDIEFCAEYADRCALFLTAES